MSQRLSQVSFGLAVGIAARLFLPGQHRLSVLLAAMLSLVGALAGEWAGERLLPRDSMGRAGFAVPALGAIAALLIYGVAMP